MNAFEVTSAFFFVWRVKRNFIQNEEHKGL